MGNKQGENKPKSEKEEMINKNSFEYLSIIGRGGFGKVWKVQSRKYNKTYAMKEMSKTKIIDKKSEKSIKSERDLLSRMKHPSIINMHFSFQDKDYLYLVMDLLTGGDLRYHICKRRRFSETETKFFIACIILGLEYCHHNKIIHRDIKPENLVLDERGYVKITDFGIAKIQQPGNARETSGTPGYMSPEVMCAQDHTIAVDYFAVGVIGFEFMKGIRPYLGKSRKEIKEKMMAHQAQIKRQEIPDGWSLQGADCINRMLQRKPMNRLGVHGAQEVKEHAWFNDFNWKELYNMKMESPFIPRNTDNFDYKYCNQLEKIGLQTQERYRLILERDDYETVFNDYFYFNRVNIEKKKNNGEPIELEMYDNPHKVYEEGENINANLSAHYRNKSYDDVISTHKKTPMHVSNNSMNAFYAANSYIMQRNTMKKSMASLPSTGSGSTTGQGTGNSNNSTGFGFK